MTLTDQALSLYRRLNAHYIGIRGSSTLLFLYIVLALMAAGILFMVGATAEPVGAKPRPTACRPGIDYCGDRLVARPGQRNVPRRETPTPTRRAK
jgi:hypothetical protein